MSDPYKKLERQLAEAVRARGGARRRFGRVRGIVPAVAVVAVLGSGAATAAVVLAPSGSSPDDRPENQVKQALWAGRRAAAASPACRPASAGKVRLVDDPVPSWVLARLGVLRRPATAGDAVPAARLGVGAEEVLRRSVRVARAGDGYMYRLYVSRGLPRFPGLPADQLGCARVRERAAEAAAARFGADVRHTVAASVGRETRAIEDAVAGRSLTLALMELRPDGRPTGGGATVLKDHKIPATGGVGPVRRGNRRYVSLSGLLPDGVATVRIVDRDGAPPERARVVRVRDNVFHALLPHRFGPRMTVEWRDAAGRVVRRTHPRY